MFCGLMQLRTARCQIASCLLQFFPSFVVLQSAVSICSVMEKSARMPASSPVSCLPERRRHSQYQHLREALATFELEMPAYASFEVLREKLAYAVANVAEFGLA